MCLKLECLVRESAGVLHSIFYTALWSLAFCAQFSYILHDKISIAIMSSVALLQTQEGVVRCQCRTCSKTHWQDLKHETKRLKGRKMKLLHVQVCPVVHSAILLGHNAWPKFSPSVCHLLLGVTLHAFHTVTHTHAVPYHHHQPEPWGWSDSITSQS